MGILTLILLGIIPVIIILPVLYRYAHRPENLHSGQALSFALLVGSNLLLLVEFLLGWAKALESLRLVMYLLLPVSLVFLALLLLNLRSLRGGTRQGRLRALGLVAVLVLLVAGLALVASDIALILLAGSTLLALLWAVASRWEGIALLLSLLVLLALAVSLSYRVSHALWEQPDWLSKPFSILSYFGASLAVALAAVWMASAVHRVSQAEKPVPSPAWRAALPRFAMALLLLASLAYAIIWLAVWDQTSDGISAIWFALQGGLMGVAAGAVMGMKAKDWFRSSGFFFALLVPAMLFGAFSYGFSLSYHDLTLTRAVRIERALERYHERTGSYPNELSELTPRELLWVPGQVILWGEDWCYAGGKDKYLLGVYWREYFSSPLELRFLRDFGDGIPVPKACEERLMELTKMYEIILEPGAEP